MTAIFEYEKTVLQALEVANIDGLQLRTSADVSAEKFKSIQKPTAIVALGEEVALKATPTAVLTETQVLVYVVLRGATPERDDSDQFYRDEIFEALHGSLLPGLSTPLEWRSTVSDYEQNMRVYLMAFAAQHPKRKRGG